MSGDEWADVGLDVRAGHLSLNDRETSAKTTTGPDILPRADSLPRPDDLLSKPPYHLFVYARSAHEIEVQCSHSGTLKFLSEYFKKWRRVNHQLSTKVCPSTYIWKTAAKLHCKAPRGRGQAPSVRLWSWRHHRPAGAGRREQERHLHRHANDRALPRRGRPRVQAGIR